jgi:hypothetical protein
MQRKAVIKKVVYLHAYKKHVGYPVFAGLIKKWRGSSDG